MEELRDVGHDTPLVRAPCRADVLHVKKLLRGGGRRLKDRWFRQARTSLHGTNAKKYRKGRKEKLTGMPRCSAATEKALVRFSAALACDLDRES